MIRVSFHIRKLGTLLSLWRQYIVGCSLSHLALYWAWLIIIFPLVVGAAAVPFVLGSSQDERRGFQSFCIAYKNTIEKGEGIGLWGLIVCEYMGNPE